MSRILLSATVSASLIGGAAFADIPSVAVDIAPVHSLVARVMDGVGQPDLIIPPGASPHEYALKPSQAEALQSADLVFWIGEDLAPWLEEAIENVATGASATALLEAEGIALLDLREDALFEAHAHEDHNDHDDHDEAAHGDEKAEDHADGHDHDDHEDHAEADGHDDHEGHAHGAHDPHAWLSPDAAGLWLNVIAAKLSAADPENAGAYFANAAAGLEEIAALKSQISATLDPVRGRNFIVFHDAYQYFEVVFDFPAAGAISLSDATDPSPARIAEIQARVKAEAVDCVLTEPQFNPAMVATVMEGTDVKTGVLDPLGAALEPGVGLYPELLADLAETLAGCLK